MRGLLTTTVADSHLNPWLLRWDAERTELQKLAGGRGGARADHRRALAARGIATRPGPGAARHASACPARTSVTRAAVLFSERQRTWSRATPTPIQGRLLWSHFPSFSPRDLGCPVHTQAGCSTLRGNRRALSRPWESAGRGAPKLPGRALCCAARSWPRSRVGLTASEQGAPSSPWGINGSPSLRNYWGGAFS